MTEGKVAWIRAQGHLDREAGRPCWAAWWVASGMSLDRFLQTRIFEPLQMTDTFFYVPDEKVSRLATAYKWYEEKGLERFPEEPIVEGSFVYSADYAHGGPGTYFSGGGGLCSTVGDYARFCRILLGHGRTPFLRGRAAGGALRP